MLNLIIGFYLPITNNSNLPLPKLSQPCYSTLIKPSSSAIIINNKKILLLLRDDDPSIPNPNKWSLPGGEIEEGETAEQAFLRELQEETNLQPNYYEYLGKIYSPAGIYHEFFLVKLSDKELPKIKLGNEGQELKFHSFEDLLKIPITAGMEHYLKKYASYLKEILENDDLKIDSSKLGLKKLKPTLKSPEETRG